MRPPTIPIADALGLVITAQALLLMLAALVVGRKLRRDRRERAALRRRAEFAAALASGSIVDLSRMLRVCTREPKALEDLLYVIECAEPLLPERRAALLEVARRVRLVRQLRRDLDSHRPIARGVAALVLSALRLPGCEARVGRLIGDPDADVRLAACSALASWATRAAASALLGALQRGDLPPERIVEQLAGVWAAPVVYGALQDSIRPAADGGTPSVGRPGNRVQLIRALELSGFEGAEPELLELLARGDLEEQISAARALGGVGSPQAVPALLEALESPSWPLRAQAARALGRLAAVEALPQLAEHLADQAWWVRKQAGRALVALGPAGGFRLLERALTHDDRFARDRAAEELRIATLARNQSALPLGITVGDLDSIDRQPLKEQAV